MSVNSREYRCMVNLIFTPILIDYGFNEVVSTVEDFTDRYVSDLTIVEIRGINWGENIDVRIGRVLRDKNEEETYPIDSYIEAQHPGMSIKKRQNLGLLITQQEQLEYFAKICPSVLDHYLKGDFSDWEVVLREQAIRIAKQIEWDSSASDISSVVSCVSEEVLKEQEKEERAWDEKVTWYKQMFPDVFN